MLDRVLLFLIIFHDGYISLNGWFTRFYIDNIYFISEKIGLFIKTKKEFYIHITNSGIIYEEEKNGKPLNFINV